MAFGLDKLADLFSKESNVINPAIINYKNGTTLEPNIKTVYDAHDSNTGALTSNKEPQPEQPPQSTDSAPQLVPPLNYTDPAVYHDPSLGPPNIVTKYQPTDAEGNGNEEGDIAHANEDIEINKVEGREFPLVLLNTTLLQSQQIQKMTIYYEGFLPTIYLKVRDDQDGTIKYNNSPGLNNHIYVILVPELEGVYKNISLEFYIDTCDFSKGDSYTFTGHLWIQTLEQEHTCQIKYPGCPNVKKKQGTNGQTADQQISCNPAPNIWPNTWEYLHEIAKATGLGFAATDKCREIQDRLPRLVQHCNLKQFIQNQIIISGLDEYSIFDVWIDFYRYIVMVNVDYVFNEDIDPDHLAINAVVGKSGHAKKMPKAEFKLVHRTLTCSNKTDGLSNLEYEEHNFTQISNNDIHTFGLLATTPYIKLMGGTIPSNGESNDMTTKDTSAQESSTDGSQLSQYNTSEQKPVTFCVDPYPTNNQKTIRQKYFELKRSKMFKLVLNRVNLGLQRGTLINIHKSTTNPQQKQKSLTAISNVEGEIGPNTKKDPLLDAGKINPSETYRDIALEESAEVLDVARSGLYYIDSMQFDFDPYEEKIIQTLFLIKKGDIQSYNNINNSAKLEPEDHGHLDSPTPSTGPVDDNFSEVLTPAGSGEKSQYVLTGGLAAEVSGTSIVDVAKQWYSKFF